MLLSKIWRKYGSHIKLYTQWWTKSTQVVETEQRFHSFLHVFRHLLVCSYRSPGPPCLSQMYLLFIPLVGKFYKMAFFRRRFWLHLTIRTMQLSCCLVCFFKFPSFFCSLQCAYTLGTGKVRTPHSFDFTSSLHNSNTNQKITIFCSVPCQNIRDRRKTLCVSVVLEKYNALY